MAEKDPYQILVEQMAIPKSTKVTMTLWGFNVLDIGGLALGLFAGLGLSNMFQVGPILKTIFIVLGVVTALLLVMRTPLAPKNRNWKVLFSVLTQDKGHYYPIRIAKKERRGR